METVHQWLIVDILFPFPLSPVEYFCVCLNTAYHCGCAAFLLVLTRSLCLETCTYNIVINEKDNPSILKWNGEGAVSELHSQLIAWEHDQRQHWDHRAVTNKHFGCFHFLLEDQIGTRKLPHVVVDWGRVQEHLNMRVLLHHAHCKNICYIQYQLFLMF